MFVRSILIPSLLVCAISAPILLSEKNVASRAGSEQPVASPPNSQFASFPGAANSNTFLPNGSTQLPNSPYTGQPNIPSTSRNLSVQSQYAPHGQLMQQAGQNPGGAIAPMNAYPPQQPINPALRSVPFGLVSQPQSSQSSAPSQQTWDTHINQFQNSLSQANPAHFATNPALVDPSAGTSPMASYPTAMQMDPFAGMTPDLAATQTFVFSGNALGPDLSSGPLEFMPITDFREVIRFDVTPEWVKQRWNRVSTNPGDIGLRGLRVALVTGTNSWDLHGSLTYYFDSRQRLQRISFRGWTGDASRLIQLLSSQYGFQAQPTTLAGFYLAQHRRKAIGGLMMKEPPVISSDNPTEQLAIVMEVNLPDGSFFLSEEFKMLIAGSH